jgi:hypothetical protein
MAWGMAFETSRDFFGELIPFGLVTQEAVATAAPAAWKAYGAWYMANRVPANREIPWARKPWGRLNGAKVQLMSSVADNFFPPPNCCHASKTGAE